MYINIHICLFLSCYILSCYMPTASSLVLCTQPELSTFRTAVHLQSESVCSGLVTIKLADASYSSSPLTFRVSDASSPPSLLKLRVSLQSPLSFHGIPLLIAFRVKERLFGMCAGLCFTTIMLEALLLL